MEETKVDPMYMENLSEWLFEEERVVTYKYLARSLKLHVNVAKQMLFNFRTENEDKLATVFLLSGLVNEDGGQFTKVSLVKDGEELDAMEKQMTKLFSKHIYSLQRAESPVTFSSLYSTDLEVFKEDPISCGTSCSSIKNRAAVPKEDLRKKVIVAQKEEKKPEIVKKEPVAKKGALEDAFSKTKKPSPVKNATNKDDKAKAPAVNKAKKQQTGNLANMFAKQASKPKVEKVQVEEKVEEKENIANEKIEDEAIVKEVKDEASSNKSVLSEQNSKKSPTTKKKSPVKASKSKSLKKEDDSKKRKRIQVLSDSEESEAEEETNDVKEEAMEDEAVAPKTALIESDDDEVVPATPKVEPSATRTGRRKVKKLVDKTYLDDDGYMVTKKVYESGSETDDEPEPESKPVVKKSPVKIEAPAAKKAKLGAPAAKAQPGIMNFFKKK